jgi:hypothetical protein
MSQTLFPEAPGDLVATTSNHNFSELYAGWQAVGITYYLDPLNGVDTNTGLLGAPVKTLSVGYGLLRDGFNDTLIYIPGSASITLTAGFTWAKNYAHFIGACAPVQVAQRCRIFSASTATGITGLITVSGTGCIFKNIYFFHGANDTTASFAGVVSGQRNFFQNVHFAGIGHASLDVAGAGSLSIPGGAENRFVHCAIGLDTITRSTSTCELQFSLAATRNEFESCLIYSYIGAAGHALAQVSLTTGIDRWQIFNDCLFQADSTNQATALTSVFKVVTGTVQGIINLKDCSIAAFGTTAKWDSANTGVVFSNMPTATATAGGGLATHS